MRELKGKRIIVAGGPTCIGAATASLERTHSPRLGEPTDLASAVIFLLSEDAEWINGQVWSTDVGMVLGD